MPLQSERIWLPDHFRESQERAVAQAVEEYDSDLSLGYRKDTGEWCAFLPGNRASDGQPFPVYSFGGELPTPDGAKKALYTHDIRRRGGELLDQLERIYDDEQAKIAARTTEASEAVAEAIDSNMRMRGTHPFPRVFVRPKYGGGRARSSG